jgi:hypothetical protein
MKQKEIDKSDNKSEASAITVLTAFNNNTVKRYQIGEAGAVICIPYGQESHFKYDIHHVEGIAQLGSLIAQLSQTQNTILIRGVPTPGLPSPIRRKKGNFPEHSAGCSWAMLDFDDLPVPEGMSPTSQDAIEYAISKLPKEFRNSSYFFQFSSSAGIIKMDGSPLKTGLNVHLFFCFDRPVPGILLAAYLERYCTSPNHSTPDALYFG